MPLTEVSDVQVSIRSAEQKIEAALNEMVAEIGPGWSVAVDIGVIDVASIRGPGWYWRAKIKAKLSSQERT